MVDYKSYSNCNSLPELLLPVATFSFIQGCVSGSGQRKILEPNPYKKTYMDPDIKRGQIRIRIRQKVRSGSGYRKIADLDTH